MESQHQPSVWDFPGGPVVQSPPCSTKDAGSVPDQGTKIPHAVEQLSLFHNLSPCTQRRIPHDARKIASAPLGPDKYIIFFLKNQYDARNWLMRHRNSTFYDSNYLSVSGKWCQSLSRV